MYYKIEGIENVIKEIENKSKKALGRCGDYLEEKLKDEVSKDSYDTWTLAWSINRQYQGDDTVIVGTNLNYAVVREYGRQPWKYPPFDALVGWGARKGMIQGWATTSYNTLSSKDKSTIYLIARKIKIKGIEGKHTFEKVRAREKRNVYDLFTKIMQW